MLLASENPSNPSAPACPDGGSNWCQQFAYDIFGNRTVPGSTGTGLITPAGISTATNRITDSNWTYDAAGNAAQQGVATAAYKYDSENRMVAACASEGPSTCTNSATAGRTLYAYDGDGRRVMKQTAAGTTTYVYDAAGELMLEYAAQPPVLGTLFLTADQLGSTRLITRGTAMPMSRHDFRPFGDEILRSGVVGYGSDSGVKEKFTGKERDAETGLDFFGARYFSGGQGRFSGPDEALADQHAEDPQSWNLYSYTRNNPLRYVDSDGRGVLDVVVAATKVLCTAAQEGAVGLAKSAVNDFIRMDNGFRQEFNSVGGHYQMLPELPPSSPEQATKMRETSGIGVAMVGGRSAEGEELTPSERPGKNDLPVNTLDGGQIGEPNGPKLGSSGGPGAGHRATAGERSEALSENNGTCVFCGKSANKAEHAIPVSRGGNNTTGPNGNLQPACTNCNRGPSGKHAQTTEFLRRKQDQKQ